MEKYNRKIVYDYIYGNDIENYTLEELENDPIFMSKVILLSRDKNFYHYVEDSIKQDYSFVKSLLEAFPEDDKFLMNAVDTYLKSNDNELNKIEALVVLCSIIKNKNSEEYIKYKLILRAKYLKEKEELLAIKSVSTQDLELKKQVGEGFFFIYDRYNDNKIVLDYYTKEMIRDILSEKYLEERLHSDFKEAGELDTIAQRTYLINILSNYDSMLSSYVSANPSILNESLTIISKIQKNWNRYIDLRERELYENVYEIIHSYMNYEEPSSSMFFTEDEILYLLGKELNILDLIIKYDKLDKECYKDIIDVIEEHPKESYTFIEKKHYNNLKKAVQDVIKGIKHQDAYTLDKQELQSEIIDFTTPKKGTKR